MKVIRTFAVALSTGALIGAAALPAIAVSPNDTICHYNQGSKSFTFVTVKGGVENSGHAKHVDDRAPIGEACPLLLG